MPIGKSHLTPHTSSFTQTEEAHESNNCISKFYRENISQNGKYTDMNFATYIAYSMPIAVINLFLVWIILGGFYLGRPKANINNNTPSTSTDDEVIEDEDTTSDTHVAKLLQRKLDELGKMSFHEIVVILLITIAVILWLFRDPRVIPGWRSLFPSTYPAIGDSTVAVAVLLLMFIIPKKLEYFRGGKHREFVSSVEFGNQTFFH